MARRRSTRSHRSMREWSVRVSLALVAASWGVFSVTQTLAYAMRSKDPERAHHLAPGDGRITALLAQTLVQPELGADARPRGEQLARAALQEDSTAVPAVVALGIAADLRGDSSQTRRLFGYAQRLSRRDLPTQLWALENAVGNGDITAAVYHYDIALRTSRNAADLLFPVLGAAISQPTIRTALTRTLVARPIWGQAFVDYVAGNGPDARATALLLFDLHRAGAPISNGANAAVINALMAGGATDAAWSYYAGIRPGSVRTMSRDPHFSATDDVPTMLDWVPINDDAVTTSIQREDRGGVFDFFAPAGIGGALLRQVQMLPPGRYRLEGHSRNIEQPADTMPYWVVTCHSSGRELGRVILPHSAHAQGAFVGDFDVPPGCPVQELTLIARASDAVGGLTGQIDQVRVMRVMP